MKRLRSSENTSAGTVHHRHLPASFPLFPNATQFNEQPLCLWRQRIICAVLHTLARLLARVMVGPTRNYGILVLVFEVREVFEVRVRGFVRRFVGARGRKPQLRRALWAIDAPGASCGACSDGEQRASRSSQNVTYKVQHQFLAQGKVEIVGRNFYLPVRPADTTQAAGSTNTVEKCNATRSASVARIPQEARYDRWDRAQARA